MSGEPTAEIPRGGVNGESTIQRPVQQQPETVPVVKPNTTTDRSLGSASQEAKPTLTDAEWTRILGLGGKPFLDITPEEIAELQNLTAKGKGLLGDNFNQELARKNTEAIQQKKDRINRAFREMTEKFNSGAQALAKTTQQSLEQGDSRIAKLEKTIRQKMDVKPAYEEVLGELQKDPQHSQAATEIEWLDVKMGKPIKNLDPGLQEEAKSLQKEIDNLRQNASAMISRDVAGYTKAESILRERFFKLRGVDPQSQQKNNTI